MAHIEVDVHASVEKNKLNCGWDVMYEIIFFKRKKKNKLFLLHKIDTTVNNHIYYIISLICEYYILYRFIKSFIYIEHESGSKTRVPFPEPKGLGTEYLLTGR